MMRSTLRIRLVTNPTGCPSVRTTRSPFIALPGVRPEWRTSKKMS